jgi:hypothetical protein
MNKDQLFVERRPQGIMRFGVRIRSAQAMSSRMQREAIDRARELNPTGTPLVERVRSTDRGHPDKWRKP